MTGVLWDTFSFGVAPFAPFTSWGDLVEAIGRGTDHTASVDPVARLYGAFLGRTPDASGLKFWVGREQAENNDVPIASIFLLGRAPNATEVTG